VTVSLSEYQGLGYFLPPRKYLGEPVLEGTDNGPNLVGIDDGAVELCRRPYVLFDLGGRGAWGHMRPNHAPRRHARSEFAQLHQ
jgi:hypothetical protein